MYLILCRFKFVTVGIASMVERMIRMSRVLQVESSNPNCRSNLTQSCKRFATASTSSSYFAFALWRGVGYRKLITRFRVIRRV